MGSLVGAGVPARRDEAAQAVQASSRAEPEYDDEMVDMIFGFTTPSPDDSVLAARAGATGRPAPAAPSAAAPAAAAAAAPASAALQHGQHQAAPASAAKPKAKSAKAAPSRAVVPKAPAAMAPAASAASDAAEGQLRACLAHRLARRRTSAKQTACRLRQLVLIYDTCKSAVSTSSRDLLVGSSYTCRHGNAAVARQCQRQHLGANSAAAAAAAAALLRVPPGGGPSKGAAAGGGRRVGGPGCAAKLHGSDPRPFAAA